MRKKLIWFCVMISLIIISSNFAGSQYVTNESLDLNSEKDKAWFENNPDQKIVDEEYNRLCNKLISSYEFVFSNK